jgi:hypothetical protein
MIDMDYNFSWLFFVILLLIFMIIGYYILEYWILEEYEVKNKVPFILFSSTFAFSLNYLVLLIFEIL